MASVNKVILIGNLGRDPEPRYNASGDMAICNVSIATTRKTKDQEETEWHRVVLFGKQAEIAQKYLRKENSVYVEGRLRTRKYTDKQGVERYQTEIIADYMQFVGGREQGQAQQTSASDYVPPFLEGDPMAGMKDDIPF